MDQRELAEYLKKNPQIIQSLMNSPDGQALMRLLQGRDGGQTLNRASSQAAAGNTAEMVQMIKGVMSSPGGAELLQRISRSLR